jgi:DNA-binding transcriptional MerR regulator
LPKAKEAFRNIGEVAAELAIKKHVLRFWEQKFPQLRPMKRGGGRRLYRPSDVLLLRGIRDLLQTAGYTIKGVQKILREQGVDQVKHAAPGRPLEVPNAAPPAAKPQPIITPRVLSVAQVQALRHVMAELDACQAMLAAASRAKRDGPDHKRASRVPE